MLVRDECVVGWLQNLNKETTIKAANGRPYPALTVFAHALGFFYEHALQELSDQSATTIVNDDIRWIITVPAIWKAPAKQFMRLAAYQVIDSVEIVGRVWGFDPQHQLSESDTGDAKCQEMCDFVTELELEFVLFFYIFLFFWLTFCTVATWRWWILIRTRLKAEDRPLWRTGLKPAIWHKQEGVGLLVYSIIMTALIR